MIPALVSTAISSFISFLFSAFILSLYSSISDVLSSVVSTITSVTESSVSFAAITPVPNDCSSITILSSITIFLLMFLPLPFRKLYISKLFYLFVFIIARYTIFAASARVAFAFGLKPSPVPDTIPAAANRCTLSLA